MLRRDARPDGWEADKLENGMAESDMIADPIQTREGNKPEDLLREARKRATHAYEYWHDNYRRMNDDRAFLAGKQWPDQALAQRAADGRPALTLNKLPQYVDQVVGAQRQNRSAIHVHPVDRTDSTVMSEDGVTKYTHSQVYEGIIRNIEYMSNGFAHYDRAFEAMVRGGIGWLRVLTGYPRPDSFHQELIIQSVLHSASVLIDPNCREPDYADMDYCFIVDRMPREEFRRRYKDKSSEPVAGDDNLWWDDGEYVRVAEYFRREPAERVLLRLNDGRIVWKDEVEEVLSQLANNGVFVSARREVNTHRVKWMKISGNDILEDEIDWPGSTIPVVPVLGKMEFADGKPIYSGLIHHAKDAQRMHNYWMTSATERVALAPKAQWVADADSIEDYANDWENANNSNKAVLRYDAKAGVPPPKREAPPAMPAAELTMAQSMTDEIKATIGIYDASLGRESNETSGRAILARQEQGDRGTFAFVSNMNMAVARVGRILVECIPRVYTQEQVVRIRHMSGEDDFVTINQEIQTDGGESVIISDLSVGRYDVVVDAGPAYKTQRMEAANAMMQFLQSAPNFAQYFIDIMAENMDWPGSDSIAKRFKVLLPENMLTEKERQQREEEHGEQQPTPEQQAEMAKAQADAEKAQADTARSQAEVQRAQLLVQEAQARLELRLAELQDQRARTARGTDAAMENRIRQMVARAIAEATATSGG